MIVECLKTEVLELDDVVLPSENVKTIDTLLQRNFKLYVSVCRLFQRVPETRQKKRHIKAQKSLLGHMQNLLLLQSGEHAFDEQEVRKKLQVIRHSLLTLIKSGYTSITYRHEKNDRALKGAQHSASASEYQVQVDDSVSEKY